MWLSSLAFMLALASAQPGDAQQRVTAPPQPEGVEAQDLGGGDAIAAETAPAPGSRQIAEQEWGDLKRSAGEIWDTAVATFGPYLATMNAEIAMVALAAALGGFAGARMRRGGTRTATAPPQIEDRRRRGREPLPTVPAAPRSALPPPMTADRTRTGEPPRSFAGHEPRLSGEDFAQRPAGEPQFGHARAAPPQAAPQAAPMAPPPARDPETEVRLQEANRLFAFFGERFGPDTSTAAGAIDYLTRLGGSVEGLRKRLADRDSEIERLKAQPTPAPQPPAQAAAHTDDSLWSTLIDGGRMIRTASQALQTDTNFQDFARETKLADAMRNIAALRADFDDGRRGVAAGLIEEAWPHVLFRAEALATAYYPTISAWRDLRLGLASSASALRHLLRRQNVFVDYVLLLNPIESAESEPWSDAGGLRNLGPVRRTLAANAGPGSEELVIDCESFGYFDKARDRHVRSKVILFNRTEWR
ncbi:MAG: hypothetical protein AAGF51_17320 [Pseudomonadota bacterium]